MKNGENLKIAFHENSAEYIKPKDNKIWILLFFFYLELKKMKGNGNLVIPSAGNPGIPGFFGTDCLGYSQL